MAFASNASAFGIKPAGSTTSIFGAPKPAGSLFGQPQQQQQQQPQQSAFGSQPQAQQTTGLFGQQQPQQPAATGGLFGQPQQQQQPAATGGLFGQQQQQQPAATGGLFGQPQQQQQAPATTSLFGQPAQQQPAAGGSLFGQPAQQQQNQTGTTSLFGQPAQQQQNQTGTTNLFGQPQQPAATGSLFGQPSQQNNQQSTLGGGFGLFGGNQSTQQPQQQTSLFGAQPAASGFGSTQTTNPLFGGAKPQQSTLGLSAAQPAGQPLFTKSTKFNDLPDELKKVFENIDSHIQGRVQISKELHQLKLGEEALKGQELIQNARKELVNAASITHSDLAFTQDLKEKADQAVQDTIVATRIIDGFKNPQQHGAYLKNHATFPLEFFTRITMQMKERLTWYKSTIEQIERKLSSTANQAQYTPQSISATLQAQHAIFLTLASKTAALETELQKIKTIYTQLWRSKTGSMRDPFDNLEQSTNGDFGLGGLNVSSSRS
ncbi:hypothetical protein HGRIS_010123 [Hohenbuehelia grisea]|uniref:Nucleoporin p58/p45 n=1 Tax=Hohenbuehelia grisea TaxID=104357 RepID=A0ABR3J3I7_9AGAR